MIKINILILAALIISQENGYAWNAEVTHKDLSRYAVDISILQPCAGNANQQCNYLQSVGLVKGLNEELVWNSRTQIVRDWLAEGGELEDYATRWRNHFHNPLQPWLAAGLSDLWSGQSALLWAQSYNDSQQPMADDWSWQRTRKLYHLALTSTDADVRSMFFAQTFRGLGQQMHLLQDMAVPAHVRNDAHPLDALVGNNGNGSYFETWVKENKPDLPKIKAFAPNPTKPDLIFSTPTDNGETYVALAPITQLFDTNQYVVGALPSTSNTIGLSEYTNANFFSDDTINMPLVWVSDGHSYPYPNAGSTNLQDYISSNVSPTTIIAEDGVADTGFWIQKTGDEPIVHFVKPGYVTNNAYDLVGGGYIYYRTFDLDDECHRDYAEKLLPRAVGYSAALLDYFFRGTIDIGLPDDGIYGIAAPGGTFNKIKLKARNATASGEQMSNGTIELVVKYKEALVDPFQVHSGCMEKTGQFFYLIASAANGITGLPTTNTTLTFNLPGQGIPLEATDVSLQVVFKGQLGNEAGAVAVGFKDISEPTPLDIRNDTDYVCIGGEYYPADSQQARDAVAAIGMPGADVSSVDITNDYLAFTSPGALRYASSTNYHAYFAGIAPGRYGRVYFLTDNNADYYFSDRSDVDPTTLLYASSAMRNQDTITNNVLDCSHDNMEMERDVALWDAIEYYVNGPYPYNSVCSWTNQSLADLTPVPVTIRY